MVDRGEQLWEIVKDAADHMTRSELQARIAALEAQLAERVKVKPLEWSPVEGWNECSRERAPAFGGEYQIVMLDPGEGELPSLYFEIGLGAFMFRFEQDQDPMGLPGETSPKKFPSVKAAKAAAQADFERRILSALEATPPARKEPESVRRARNAIFQDQDGLAAPPAPKVTESPWATVQRGYDEWAAKPHNKKWVNHLAGTPIPNDLVVCIVSALTAAQEAGKP